MARGKIQIKRIENTTNRQVTYSKRRNGLFKKAKELTVLCDAKVSILMLSSTNKLHEFISPNTSTKEMYDQYQKALGVDVWISHCAKMQEDLRKLQEYNRSLQRDIRRRMGDCLNDLGMEELVCLQQEMENAVGIIRERKYKVIANQTETTKKKVRNGQTVHRSLVQAFEALRADPQFGEDPHYGLVDNGATAGGGGDYEPMLGFPHHLHHDHGHGPNGLLALRLVPSHHHEPNNQLPSASGSCLTTFTLLE